MEELKEKADVPEGRKYIESPIFGYSIIPTDEEEELVKYIAELMPVTTFQALNQRLNLLGLCFDIKKIEE